MQYIDNIYFYLSELLVMIEICVETERSKGTLRRTDRSNRIKGRSLDRSTHLSWPNNRDCYTAETNFMTRLMGKVGVGQNVDDVGRGRQQEWVNNARQGSTMVLTDIAVVDRVLGDDMMVSRGVVVVFIVMVDGSVGMVVRVVGLLQGMMDGGKISWRGRHRRRLDGHVGREMAVGVVDVRRRWRRGGVVMIGGGMVIVFWTWLVT